MPGQYKIQRDSQDDFKDIQTAHNIAKRGGYWENIKSCLGLIFLLALCGFISSLMTGNASAQTSSGSCFPHTQAMILSRLPVYEHPIKITTHTSHKDSLQRGARVNILGLRTFGKWCWLQIEGGWIPYIKVSVKGVTSESAPVSIDVSVQTPVKTPVVQRCYSASKAYITGTMNIRSGPSTSSGQSCKREVRRFVHRITISKKR